ncbi:hypothetical protein F2P81_013673 [Scophthalmus maximus]|uniref:Uncharacterized protein n=1 Tax=Scophthalmus maximus TaxID=52904 RepID=A0A6A4SK34_SCOMX|nr:hypothetical protein F2P81_013673 [Scophthalmus maximus]
MVNNSKHRIVSDRAVGEMRTHRSCTRLRRHKRANGSGGLTSAHPRERVLCAGAAHPQPRSCAQNRQTWLITGVTDLGCDTALPLSDYFRASADSKSTDP